MNLTKALYDNMIREQLDKAARKYVETHRYGHVFDRDRKCSCGLRQLDYDILTPDELWARKEYCKNLK